MVTVSTSEGHVKIPRAELIKQLRARDGDSCMHPECEHDLDFSVFEGPRGVTIDHHIPQVYGKANGWTREEIWALSNLTLMHRRCNQAKGELIPNADGTLPPRPMSNFKFRRQKRAGRPELCSECDNGHNLFVGEICANCGCNAQRFPKSAKVLTTECDHEILWCIWCSIGVIERPASAATAVLQGESGEWDD